MNNHQTFKNIYEQDPSLTYQIQYKSQINNFLNNSQMFYLSQNQQQTNYMFQKHSAQNQHQTNYMQLQLKALDMHSPQNYQQLNPINTISMYQPLYQNPYPILKIQNQQQYLNVENNFLNQFLENQKLIIHYEQENLKNYAQIQQLKSNINQKVMSQLNPIQKQQQIIKTLAQKNVKFNYGIGFQNFVQFKFITTISPKKKKLIKRLEHYLYQNSEQLRNQKGWRKIFTDPIYGKYLRILAIQFFDKSFSDSYIMNSRINQQYHKYYKSYKEKLLEGAKNPQLLKFYFQ